jgi:ATP-dependent DNA helicase RecQ
MLACAADVPTLENFAYGDTPTRASLHTLVIELLSAGEAFDVSVVDLSARHDIRPLVVRTILTTWNSSSAAGDAVLLRIWTRRWSLAGDFRRPSGEPGEFVERFAAARKGRIWFKVEPEGVARTLGAERERVVRALHYLDEHTLIELRASDARLRFSRCTDPQRRDAAALVAELAARFEQREAHEVARLQQVLGLVNESACQTGALVGYFGETLPGPCGHCTSCLAGAAERPRDLPPEAPPAPLAPRLVEPPSWSWRRGVRALGGRASKRASLRLTKAALTSGD